VITRRHALTAAAVLLGLPATAQQPPRPQRPPQDPTLVAAISKSNAYINLMNRTLRATQSWDRYTSWVNVKTGPTGRERYITYGLYSLYDVRSEVEKAKAAMAAEPKSPELDASLGRYLAAYEALAPIITQANGYYERQDYKVDNMAEGKALHARLVPAAETYIAERAKLEVLLRAFKREIDDRELAAIVATEGKTGRYQVKIVMMRAQEIMDFMPSDRKPIVDMKGYDEALARFAPVVREFDAFNAANPGQMSGFDSYPSRFLGKLREFQTKLQKSKGDARRGAGQDVTWIVNDYNMMISSAQMAMRFSR
jgi:hypothetical protein